jgi:hypothetical protein
MRFFWLAVATASTSLSFVTLSYSSQGEYSHVSEPLGKFPRVFWTRSSTSAVLKFRFVPARHDLSGFVSLAVVVGYEGAIRPIALRRKNWLLIGSEGTGKQSDCAPNKSDWNTISFRCGGELTFGSPESNHFPGFLGWF